MNNFKFVIVALVLTAAAAIVFSSFNSSMYEGAGEVMMEKLPKSIGEWRGEDIPIPEKDYEILGTRNLIMRKYTHTLSEESVYLYIIYSVDNRKSVHPPEICYTGAGANAITEKSVIALTDTIKANKFSVDSKNSRQSVVYWFKSADLNTHSYIQQQLKMVMDRMLRKKTSSAMLRVSALLKNNDSAAALRLIQSFCRQIAPLFAQYVP